MGILINTGFDLGSSSPIDNRTVKNTIDERDALVTDGKVYENLKVYCKDTQKEYRWTGTEWEEVGTVDLSGYAKTYTSLTELGLTADATVQDVVDALPKGGSALLGVKEFTNYQTIFPYEDGSDQFARVHIIKGLEDGSCMYARWFRKDGSKEAIAIFNTNDNKFNGWRKLQTGNTKTLIANTTTLKLDITKKNSALGGAIKLTYVYAASLVEIEMSFISSEVRWAVISGQKYIKNITFTLDSSNSAHYTIGIQFAGKVYGCYQAEAICDFADINSLTSEAFTGAKTAVYYSPWGKNNGVSLVSAPEDIGLTFPCTTVQLAQAMRDKFNKTINAGAIGVFNCEVKAKTITDAPSDYGLLHIETFGSGRVMIRFDGISGANYAGSWIGQIKSTNDTFSSITWTRIDLETQVNELFQSVSSGKTSVANAITGKGVSTSSTATFATMATNISKINAYKEETKSYNVASEGTFSATFTFSADVLGIKQIILPTSKSSLIPQSTKESFKIGGKNVTMTITGVGMWKVTALIKV